jgi:hypothetical protein
MASDQMSPSEAFEPGAVADRGALSIDRAVLAEIIERVIIHRSDIEIVWHPSESEITKGQHPDRKGFPSRPVFLSRKGSPIVLPRIV